MLSVQQAIVALGCWLCNRVATGHLQKRQVARAFAYTRTCERWLKLRRGPSDDMWLKLRFDCAFNAAELAQSSEDLPKAVDKLRACERLQSAMQDPPEPEAVHICMAEVLLQGRRHIEAAVASQRAVDVLQPQQGHGNERKRYSLLFAYALEQSALAAVDPEFELTLRRRALQCLPDAEAAFFAAPCDEPTPVDEASRALLAQMRRLHYELMLRHQASQQAEEAMEVAPPAHGVADFWPHCCNDASDLSGSGWHPVSAFALNEATLVSG